MNQDSLERLASTLEDDVYILSEQIGERNMYKPGSMERTVDWLDQRIQQLGFNSEKLPYKIQGGQFDGKQAANLVAELTGTTSPEKIVVIGAHYDSVYGSPGANDNASAVAVLLELAEYFYDNPQSQTIRFTLFANEEPPFFHTQRMGSYAYASECRSKNEQITAMIALDGLGYFSDQAGSQRYPVPGLGLKYSGKADFIGLIIPTWHGSL
jgi:hypothetical protein